MRSWVGWAKRTTKAAVASPIGRAARPPEARTPGAASGTAVTGALPAPPAEQDHGDGLHHDLEVLEQALAPDILEVELHLFPDVVEASVIVMIDLREAGNAGLGPLAQGVLRNVRPQVGEDRGALGAGADDAHLALADVDQLGQLVEPVLPQEPADLGDAGIVLRGPDGARLVLRVHEHRAELVDRERLPAEVESAAMVAVAERPAAPVETYA